MLYLEAPLTETKGERIARQMSEEWSSYLIEIKDYGLDVWGDDWREFWKELREKIDGEEK